MEASVETPPVGRLLDLTGRVAAVTGAGSGIGAAVARRMAEAGAAVAVHYHRNAAGAEEVRDGIGKAGGRAITLRGDMTRPEEVEALFRSCADRLGGVDILVNNAGVYPLAGVVEMSPGEWDDVVATNLRSVHLGSQAAARWMIDGGRGGAIVNVASIEAVTPLPRHAHYAASKAGVVAYTRAAAAELGSRGIRVNAVSPGLIRREGIEEAWPDGVERWRDACPLRRLGTPEDVADACLFLASAAGRWITGADLRVDGGVLCGPPF